jgi:hypothetical protein
MHRHVHAAAAGADDALARASAEVSRWLADGLSSDNSEDGGENAAEERNTFEHFALAQSRYSRFDWTVCWMIYFRDLLRRVRSTAALVPE